VSDILTTARNNLRDIDQVSLKTAVGLIEEIERLRESVAWHERRWAELQKQQAQMRDPERKMVCDILANGKTYERAAFAKEDK